MPSMTRKLLGVDTQPYEAFGRVVRAARQERELSQEELGARSDLDRTYISGVERGKRNPTIQSIWLIAGGLGMKPSELMAEVEQLLGSGGL